MLYGFSGKKKIGTIERDKMSISLFKISIIVVRLNVKI